VTQTCIRVKTNVNDRDAAIASQVAKSINEEFRHLSH
jgi:hypothetical protein